MGRPRKAPKEKQITRYTYDELKEPRTPETGHTRLIGDEQTVTLAMDNGWSGALEVGRLSDADEAPPIIVDIDPLVDPILLWAGKRNKRDVPVLPLQRNEIVSESRIVGIIERARRGAADVEPQKELPFGELEKSMREGDRERRVEFYTHEEGWRNKLICGDSLPVMESLIHYEGLRGQVQMIYIDPPYGVNYDSNFQQRVDSTKNNEKDQADDVLAVKAFRDTWSLGIHSYLSYLQERLYMCRELLAETGSVLVQINDENIHLVRSLMDEVFGAKNHYATIVFNKTTGFTDRRLSGVYDCLVWYAKDVTRVKYRQLYQRKGIGLEGAGVYNKVELPDGTRRRLTAEELENINRLPPGWRVYALDNLVSQGAAAEPQPFEFEGKTYYPPSNSHWKTTIDGLERLAEKQRVAISGKSLRYVRFYDDFRVSPISNIWLDTGTGSFTEPKVYAVQTSAKVVARCIWMSTDPGDIVFDPTCGSGTTAVCAEMAGRRWITCDTSRVSINVARRRLLSAVFDHYQTADGRLANGFDYKTVERMTLKSVAFDLEPEKVELVDQPEIDKAAVRVCGPFEAMTVGRYSVEDWKGFVNESGELENYISVVCRLYRKDAAVQGASGLIHAIAESENERVAISVGPISGRVTAKQINDAVEGAVELGIPEVHVLGWAFEANVGEVRTGLEGSHSVKVELVMIRPDTLAEGLKATQPDMLFSPLALPDLDVDVSNSQAVVTLRGVGVFDRKKRSTEYYRADSGYVAAWYLDEDYDGDCFVDCQMFFDFKKAPNLKGAVNGNVNSDEFKFRVRSEPFPIRGYKRIAAKVVDVYGNESTVVRELA